jgi:hypothetical protein
MDEAKSNEDRLIYWGADHRNFASGRRQSACGEAVPLAWDQRCVVLQMAYQVWRGMVGQMKSIKDENRRMKRMYANLSMQNQPQAQVNSP